MTDSKPIVRLFFAKMKEAFADLPDVEKAALMRKDRAAMDRLGMKAFVMIDFGGSSEDWDYVGVEEWPSMEAIREHAKFENEEPAVSGYVESKTYLGTPESVAEYVKA